MVVVVEVFEHLEGGFDVAAPSLDTLTDRQARHHGENRREGDAGDHLSALLDGLGADTLVVGGPVREGVLGPTILGSTVDRLLRRPDIALLLVRIAGWQVSRLVSHPRVDAIDRRLRERGWPVVLATRLIPAVPFSVLNYAAGASSIRVLPYTLATFVGVLPGTAAIVILGDALTGQVSPALLVVSMCTAGIGVAGLIVEIRSHRRDRLSAS